MVESFDDGIGTWAAAKGTITPSATADASQGPGALALDYNLSAGSVEAGRTGTLPAFEAKAYTALTVDVKGDGTYNTLYLRLRDATGELLYYRVGNLNTTTWLTMSVNLSAAPAAKSDGNGDGVIDAPAALYRFVVVRNGTQPVAGTAVVDNVRVTTEGWTAPTADPAYFAPASGQTATVAFEAGGAGDYGVRLADAAGRIRTLTGAATAAGPQSVVWDGTADDGAALVGDVSARLSYDGTPDGTLTKPTSVGTPLVTTVAEADPSGGVETTALAEGFESGGGAWEAAKGTVTATTSADATESTSALKLAYDLTAGTTEAGYTTTPAAWPATAYSQLKLDYKGDGTFNTLYLRLRDASGEILYYRVGNLDSKTWTTASVDLRAAPAATTGGNANGVLDAPIALYRLVVVRNGTQPATGSVLVDNLRTVGDGWGPASADREYLPVDSGQSARISIPAHTAGDFALTLRDAAGSTRVLTGAADGTTAPTLDWDGLADGGQPLQGDVNATLAYDTTADGALAAPTSIGTPLLTTVAERVASSTVVESFEAAADTWTAALGTVAPRSSTDLTEGSKSLALAYDISKGTAELGRTATPPEWSPAAYSALKLDVKGDGTFNTLYLRLRDATGEVFYYRLGNLNTKTWSTVTADLRAAPAAHTGGNADGVLDGPLSLYRLVVVRNGTQPATGTILVDNLRAVGDGWMPAFARPQYFSAASGQTTTISVPAATPGDYRVVLSDPSGRTRTFSGTASASGVKTIAWDGKTSSGTLFQGNVTAKLSYDTTPDGTLTTPATVGIPYLGGVQARPAGSAYSAVSGVNSSLTTYDSITIADADAKLMEDAYVHYAREEFEWNRVEPRNGYFDWAKFDQAVAVAKARNVEVVGKLVYTADWASSAPAGTSSAQARYYPPTNMADWQDYVAQTVARYKDSVTVWEVWNEPNFDLYWKPSVDAAGYASLLKATYSTIQSISPTSTVLMGGLAGGFSESFVNSLISNGAGDSFDGIALHMYVTGAPEPSIIDTWFSTAESYVARKLPGRSLWLTEMGWSSCDTCATKVTEDEQAQYLSRFMIDAATHGVRGVMWYNLRENGTSTSSIDNFGLAERTGRVKPAWTALAKFGAATVASVPAGTANPSPNGSTTLLNDLSTTAGLTARSLGSGGSTTIAASSGRVGGAGGLAVTYNYSNSTATGGLITMSKPVSGSPTALSLWGFGDNSNTTVMLKFVDSTGESFESKIGNIGTANWTRMVFYLDGMNPNSSHSGGNNDGKVNYPITVTQLHVYKPSSGGLTSGQFILDDLSAHYGATVRGAVFIGRGYITQAVYSMTARDTKLSVPNTTAYIYDRGKVDGLSVTDQLAAVTLTPTPKYVISTPAVSPVSGPTQSPVTLSLVTGDRTTVTVQIYTKAGVLVRTIMTAQAVVSGPRKVTWDGKKSDGTWALAGAYVYRIMISGADGRTSVLTRDVTLR